MVLFSGSCKNQNRTISVSVSLAAQNSIAFSNGALNYLGIFSVVLRKKAGSLLSKHPIEILILNFDKNVHKLIYILKHFITNMLVQSAQINTIL